MKVVRFLERQDVIRFFGVALVLAPFANMALHVLVQKSENHMTWAQISLWTYLRSGNPVSYFLMVCSIVIGATMLSGSTKAWKFVLVLIGSHLLMQIVNINSKAWQGPLAWPTFIINAALFFFIFDQLVWKVSTPDVPIVKTPDSSTNAKVTNLKTARQVMNLKSYRKILFSFGSHQPWGELKTLSSEELSVKSFAPVPARAESEIIEINFARDVIVEIQFAKREGDMYFFTPLNMDKQKVKALNKWLKKIAV